MEELSGLGSNWGGNVLVCDPSAIGLASPVPCVTFANPNISIHNSTVFIGVLFRRILG